MKNLREAAVDIISINEAMTRKDFVAFAVMMKSVKTKNSKEMWETIIDSMVDIFTEANPQFQPDRFKKAAGDTR